MSQHFQKEYLGIPAEVPRVGQTWKCRRLPLYDWHECEILEVRRSPRGWNEYCIRHVNFMGNMQEEWWRGELEPVGTPTILGRADREKTRADTHPNSSA